MKPRGVKASLSPARLAVCQANIWKAWEANR